MSFKKLSAAALLSAVLCTAGAGHADEGELSPDFGTDGVTSIGIPNLEAGSVRLAMAPDGKLVLAATIAGTGGHDLLIARLTGGGALDGAFGSGGTVTLDLGGDDRASGIVVDPWGRVVVSAMRVKAGVTEIGVQRFDGTGTLDPTFDGDGRRILSFGGASTAGGVTIDLVGRILVAGTRTNESGSTMAVTRLLPDGSFDESFDGNGKRIVDFGLANGTQSDGAAVAVGDDARITVVGTRRTATSSDVALARTLDDGTFDTAFGGNGKMDFDFGGADEGRAIAISPDARLLIAGVRHGSGDDFAIAALRPDGTPASGFDGNGKRIIDFGADEIAESIGVLPDGRIVAAGTRSSPTGTGFAVTRLLVDGTLDLASDNDGKARFAPGTGDGVATGLAIQPGGRIVAAGSADAGGTVALLAAAFESWMVLPTGVLEIPGGGSAQSGIGLVSGWTCAASRVAVRIDGQAPITAAHGTPREDTGASCGGATDNGFGLLFNWALLGDGVHVVRAFADGVEFARSTFSVTTFGVPFLRDVTGSFVLNDFPSVGTAVEIGWQQAAQGFVVGEVAAPAGVTGGSRGSGLGSGSEPGARLADESRRSQGLARSAATAPGVLEIPQAGAATSGIGLISGWLCEAGRVEVEIDGTTLLPAAYGTARDDTASTCGDVDNGFGLLFNWALLGDGPHTLRALADGVEFGRVAIEVSTFGVPFLRGATGRFDLAGFPTPAETTTVEWSEPRQGFVVTAVE